MEFDDEFKPYSPKIHGNLEEYLREHDGMGVDNHFFGSRYFFVIKKMNLFRLDMTGVRVDNNPAPDIYYFVNEEFQLESRGRGKYNMSCVETEKGIYNPRKVLKNKHWSIGPLIFPEPAE